MQQKYNVCELYTLNSVKAATDNVYMATTGRPTKYKAEYCQMLIDHMESGLSFESFAAEVDVCEDTIYTWAKEFPEFSEAKKKAFSKNRSFWEKLSVKYIVNQSEFHEDKINKTKSSSSTSLNSSVFIFNMKNRFPKEWRDRQEVESNTTHNVNVNDLTAVVDVLEKHKDLIAKVGK